MPAGRANGSNLCHIPGRCFCTVSQVPIRFTTLWHAPLTRTFFPSISYFATTIENPRAPLVILAGFCAECSCHDGTTMLSSVRRRTHLLSLQRHCVFCGRISELYLW